MRNKPPFNLGSSDLGLQIFSLYPYTNPLCIRYPLEVAMGHSIRYFVRYSMRKSIGFAGFYKVSYRIFQMVFYKVYTRYIRGII